MLVINANRQYQRLSLEGPDYAYRGVYPVSESNEVWTIIVLTTAVTDIQGARSMLWSSNQCQRFSCIDTTIAHFGFFLTLTVTVRIKILTYSLAAAPGK